QRIAGLMLPAKKLLKAVLNQLGSLGDALQPLRGRIPGLGKQIALGQDEKDRQSADFAALAATVFKQPEEAEEFDEVRIDLGQWCRGVDDEDERIRRQNFSRQRAFGTVIRDGSSPNQQIIRHAAVAVDEQGIQMRGRLWPIGGKWLEVH